MAMNTSVISEYDHTYDIQLIDTQNSWAFLNITDTDDDVNDAEMMIVHSNQHKQSTQSTHIGLLVEDQEAKNGLSLSAIRVKPFFLPNHSFKAVL